MGQQYGADSGSVAHAERSTRSGEIDVVFIGGCKRWHAMYDQLVAKLDRLGSDVVVVPQFGYLSIRRKRRRFAGIKVSPTRFEMGFRRPDAEPTTRFVDSGEWMSEMTHRTQLTNHREIDFELTEFLRRAYDMAK